MRGRVSRSAPVRSKAADAAAREGRRGRESLFTMKRIKAKSA
jgi:hypothetical protein